MLFELIAARYERRSLLITANQPFGAWGKIFTDKAMTLAAIDRRVHHAIGDMAQAIADNIDDPPSGVPQPGIKPENPHPTPSP